jgi:hypothetical protein
MKINKIILVVPNSGINYYFQHMVSLAKAFYEIGADVGIISSDSDDYFKIQQYAPDVVIEINKTRNQNSVPLPKSIAHIAWIQDPRCIDADVVGLPHYMDPNFGGSDIIYTLSYPYNLGLSSEKSIGSYWDILHTGVDLEIFRPGGGKNYLRDISFCGYLPYLFTEQFTNRPVLSLNNKAMTIGDISSQLFGNSGFSNGEIPLPEIHRLITLTVNKFFDINVDTKRLMRLIPQPYMQYFDTNIPRTTERIVMFDVACKFSSFEIFGPESCKSWPKYNSRYNRMLHWQSDLCDVYRTSKIVLHNGAIGMHSRVLECMGAGGVIFVHESKEILLHRDIYENFIPGEHFVPFHMGNLEELMKCYLTQNEKLSVIGEKASLEIRKAHTWKHRAEKIMNDISRIF